MTVVDAHCHVGRQWLEPVEDLLDHMQRAGVEHAVLTCVLYAQGSDYEEECVTRYPGKFSFVGAVDTGSPKACGIVRDLVRRGASGVRIRAAGAGAASDGHLRVLQTAGEYNTTVTCFGRSAEFVSAPFIRLIEDAPDVRIVLEHLGSSQPAEVESEAVRREVFALARYENVYMKFNGLGEFCVRKEHPFVTFPFVEPIPPYLKLAYEAFGPRRLLWGSDFPNVSGREGYSNSLFFPRAQLGHLAQAEIDDMFSGNSKRLFPMGLRQ